MAAVAKADFFFTVGQKTKVEGSKDPTMSMPSILRVSATIILSTGFLSQEAMTQDRAPKKAAVERGKSEKKESALTSIVLLQSKKRELDEAKLIAAIQRAFPDKKVNNKDDADFRVAGKGHIFLVMHDQNMYLINNFSRPYWDDVNEIARKFVDLRLKRAIERHTCWVSVDLLGGGKEQTQAKPENWRVIAKIAAELIDAETVAAIETESLHVRAVSEELKTALRSQEPLKEFKKSEAPIIQVKDDDAEMAAATKKARDTWNDFTSAFQKKEGRSFAVKALFQDKNGGEFMWVSVQSFDAETVTGTLGNIPDVVKSIKYQDRISIKLKDLNDWVYFDAKGEMVGGYTISVLSRRAAEQKKSK